VLLLTGFRVRFGNCKKKWMPETKRRLQLGSDETDVASSPAVIQAFEPGNTRRCWAQVYWTRGRAVFLAGNTRRMTRIWSKLWPLLDIATHTRPQSNGCAYHFGANIFERMLLLAARASRIWQ